MIQSHIYRNAMLDIPVQLRPEAIDLPQMIG